MHIIFGDAVKEIPNRFTVLELDTFKHSESGSLSTAYCVVEKIPLSEFGSLDAHKKIHADLIDNYQSKNWTYCEHAIEALMGRWNAELDSFYSDMLLRVIGHKQTEPAADWDGTRIRV
jgi:hypothetical protein